MYFGPTCRKMPNVAVLFTALTISETLWPDMELTCGIFFCKQSHLTRERKWSTCHRRRPQKQHTFSVQLMFANGLESPAINESPDDYEPTSTRTTPRSVQFSRATRDKRECDDFICGWLPASACQFVEHASR